MENKVASAAWMTAQKNQVFCVFTAEAQYGDSTCVIMGPTHQSQT